MPGVMSGFGHLAKSVISGEIVLLHSELCIGTSCLGDTEMVMLPPVWAQAASAGALRGELPAVQVDVPDPIPLDPARDLPLSALGSTWVVAAGPSQPGASDFRGASFSTCCMRHRLLGWVNTQQHRQDIGSPEGSREGRTVSGRELSAWEQCRACSVREGCAKRRDGI